MVLNIWLYSYSNFACKHKCMQHHTSTCKAINLLPLDPHNENWKATWLNADLIMIWSCKWKLQAERINLIFDNDVKEGDNIKREPRKLSLPCELWVLQTHHQKKKLLVLVLVDFNYQVTHLSNGFLAQAYNSNWPVFCMDCHRGVLTKSKINWVVLQMSWYPYENTTARLLFSVYQFSSP